MYGCSPQKLRTSLSGQGLRFKKSGFKHGAVTLITCAKNMDVAKGSLSMLNGTRA